MFFLHVLSSKRNPFRRAKRPAADVSNPVSPEATPVEAAWNRFAALANAHSGQRLTWDAAQELASSFGAWVALYAPDDADKLIHQMHVTLLRRFQDDMLRRMREHGL